MGETVTTEVQRSAVKGISQARRVERRRACEPGIDPVEAFQSCFGHENTGVDRVSASGVIAPPPTRVERLRTIIERTAAKAREVSERESQSALTPDQLKRSAAELREAAANLERGA